MRPFRGGRRRFDEGAGGAVRGGVLFAVGCCSRRGAVRRGVLFAASVGRTLSPSASVVVPLMSDFLAYFC